MPTALPELEPRNRLVWAFGLALVVGLGPIGCSDSRPQVEADHLPALESSWVHAGWVDLGQDDDDRWIGEGWHYEEELARWSAVEEAHLTVPLRRGGPGRLKLRAMGPAPDAEPTQLTVVINGFVLPNLALGYPLGELFLGIPDGVLRAGHNRVTLACDRLHQSGSRQLGVYVDWLSIQPDGAGNPGEGHGKCLDRENWLEDRSGLFAAGPLQLDFDAQLDSTVEATLELCALDSEGAVARVLDRAPISASDSTVILTPGSDVDPATACSLRLTADGGEAHLTPRSLGRTEPARDDILLIMIDTLRADYLASYGHPSAETPTLDRLGRRGIRFQNAVGHSPITGPSHAAFFLSRVPSRAGVVNNFEGQLTTDTPTLAELLRARNYDCEAAISISSIRSKQGFGRGFSTYEENLGPAFLRDGESTVAIAESLITRGEAADPRPRFTFVHLAEPHEPYDAHGTVGATAEIRLDGDLVRTVPVSDTVPGTLDVEVEAGTRRIEIRSTVPVRLRRFGPTGADTTGSRLLPSLSDEGRKLWELTLRSQSAGTVSLPYFLSESDLRLPEIRRRYELEVEAIDRLVARLLEALRRSGRAARTWVVFTADHGEALGERGQVGHVQELYENFVRVPLILRPGEGSTLARGRVRDDVAGGIDLLPTLLAAVDVPVPAAAQGRNLLGPGDDGRALLLETHAPQATHTKYGLRSRETKLIWTPESDQWQLFDLHQDPQEKNDLFDAESADAERWKAALERRVQKLLSETQRAQMTMDAETEAALRSLGYIE